MVETKEHAVKRGKKSRAQGGVFELRTRKDLEEKGWTVSKWQNNVEFVGEHIKSEPRYELQGRMMNCRCGIDADFREGKLIPAKPKMVFNPMIKRMVPQQMNSGFPDFVAFRRIRIIEDAKFHGFSLTTKGIEPEMEIKKSHYEYEVIGVESKMTGELDKLEKEKCKWLLEQGIFSKILIAEKTKVKNKVVIVYHDFKEKYWRFYKNV